MESPKGAPNPLGAAVARAAQRYGFIVVDTAGSVAVMAESGQVWKQRTGTDPWPGILGGVPTYEQLAEFPWDRVEVVTVGDEAAGETGAAGGSRPTP